MPSAEVGGDVRRNRALNCWPWMRSFIHSPEAVIHSPAENGCRMADHGHHITTPTRFGSQNAKAILSVVVGDSFDEPAGTSWVDDSGCGFMSTIASVVSPLRAIARFSGRRRTLLMLELAIFMWGFRLHPHQHDTFMSCPTGSAGQCPLIGLERS